MFGFTPLEIAQAIVNVVDSSSKVGLITAGVLVSSKVSVMIWDNLLEAGTIASLLLAVTLYIKYHFASTDRPVIYRGRRRMSMSKARMKDRIDREIARVYDEAWFHNILVDHTSSKVNWNWL